MRVCVYTALVGGYEMLNEQPAAAESNIEFICITDDPGLTSNTWRVEARTPVFDMDPIRSQREFKIRPHVHLPSYDAALYIDNTVILREKPESIFDRYLHESPFTLFEHEARQTVLDEFLEMGRAGLDDQGRIFEQMNHYALSDPSVLQETPFWGGLLIRHHKDAAVVRAMEVWLAHVNRYSRRDQLSLNVAIKSAGLRPHVIRGRNTSSWFHSWPHRVGRDPGKGMRPPEVSLALVVAHVRRLEIALRRTQGELEQRHREIAALQAALGTEATARPAQTPDVAPLDGVPSGAAGDPVAFIDMPAEGLVVTGRVELAGWALDRASPWDSGIERVDVYLDGVLQGVARYGSRRSDVATAMGSTHFSRSGWSFQLDISTVRAGPHTIEVRARSLVTGTESAYSRTIVVADSS
jgi:hypothetical protein